MIHTGLLAHSPDGAALAFSEFCHLGPKRFKAPVHPDITLDYIAMGRTLPAWDRGDVGAVREVLAESVSRLAKSGAEFFFCPDNTAHIALEAPGPDLAIP
jgi:aspartate/glutamate racemase